MKIHEFAAYNRENPDKEYDRKCDEWLTTLGGTHDFVIAEGRLPHHFIPKGFHVLFVCDERLRVARRARDLNQDSETIRTNLLLREEADNERYAKLYGKDVLWPQERYDLVVDTGLQSEVSMVEIILEGHARWQEKLGDDMFEKDIVAGDGRVIF